MSESAPVRFTLSQRQRRLRVLTVVLLAVILGMIALGTIHPFFRSVASPAVAAQFSQERAVRRAAAPGAKPPASPLYRAVVTHLVIIDIYWMTCVLLTTAVFILAWMDVREVRRQMTRARSQIWRDIADGSRASTPKPPES